MSDTQPIDYARAESDDVVGKKFRRRVVMFVIATVVVIVTGTSWVTIGNQPFRSIRSGQVNQTFSIGWKDGWLYLNGPRRVTPVGGSVIKGYGSDIVGIAFFQMDKAPSPKWNIRIRYRTLFILAVIPWIITLIRLIRSWKRKRVLSVQC
ncbi:MAG TPA: hypothetical protein PK402_04775 [Tepidisphaeraceae bacterium]|nr:hypothetical protein [Tepidisphaeraceae bacterium]